MYIGYTAIIIIMVLTLTCACCVFILAEVFKLKSAHQTDIYLLQKILPKYFMR